MKKSVLQRHGISDTVVGLASRLVARVPWPDRRLAMADVTETLLEGKTRVAEAVFGWGRSTVALGMNEARTGIVCLNDLSRRRKPKTEEKHPQLLVDIRAIVDPESQADPRLRTTLAYTNVTAASVRKTLLASGWSEDTLPGLRTISNILNRQGYRLRMVAKTKVQKKRRGRTLSSKMCTN